MKKIFYLFYALVMLVMLSCKTLPPQTLQTHNIIETKQVKAFDSENDFLYSIDYNFMEKQKDDFISFHIDSLFYKYRLDFNVNGNIRSILSSFDNYNELSSSKKIDNGNEKIGNSSLYCYAFSKKENKNIRVLANGDKDNFIDFYFVLKNKSAFLFIDDFNIVSLDKKVYIKNKFNGIYIPSEDIDRLISFISNKEQIEISRQKKIDEIKAATVKKKAEIKK